MEFDFLKDLKLEYIEQVFRENNIDSEILAVMSTTDLKELIPKIRDRIKIRNYIEKFTQNLTFAIIEPDEYIENVETVSEPESKTSEDTSVSASTNDIKSYLQQDFKHMYPGKDNSLSSMLDLKKEEIIEYAKKAQQTRDKHCSATILQLIGLIQENDPETIKNVSLLLLAYIINISPARKRKGKPIIKYSRAGICDAYIKQVASEAEVTSEIISKREQISKQGRTLQPFVIFVGKSVTEVVAAYVVINDTVYHFNKVITAVDCVQNISFNWGLLP